MTDTQKVAASAAQPKLFQYLKSDKPLAMLGIGAVVAFIALCIANGLDMLQSVIVPSHFYSEQMIQSRFFNIAIATICGFTLGWFLSPKAKAFRTLLLGALIGVFCFFIIVDYGALGWSAAGIAAWAAFFASLGYWLRGWFRKSKSNDTHGSASWATEQELHDKGMIGTDGIRLGYYKTSVSHLSVQYTGDRHLITKSPNRSGKGTTAIIPNLLTYTGSILVIDPKGENAMITAKHRRSMGQEVHVVDPYGITGLKSSHFNPMDWLVKGDVDIGENGMLLADAMIQSMGGDQQFWDEEGKALLLGEIVQAATAPSMEGKRNLGEVRKLLMKGGDELQELFKDMAQSPYPIVRSAGLRCLQKEEKLLANVLATVQSHTHFLDSPRLQHNLSKSDFKFEDLKTKPMTIYLVLPADKLNSHGRWLRLLIQQALTVNARNIEVKPKKPVLFILDELPALGRLNMVEQAFGLMAGFGIQLWAICQDSSQLKRIYGDGWQTFIANAGVLQYFGSRDKMTAEYFSSLCGVRTVWNISTAIARSFGQSGSSTSDTTTTSGMKRPLAFPDELMRMADDKQLLLIGNGNPIMAHKLPWYENPELKDLGVNLYAKD